MISENQGKGTASRVPDPNAEDGPPAGEGPGLWGPKA